MASLYLHLLPFFLILHVALSFLFAAIFADTCTVDLLSLSTDQNSSWLSPSGEFTFGFFKLQNENLFLLAIWFTNIPDTVVWSANDDNMAPPGSTVKLTGDGKLALYDPNGESLWERPEIGAQAKPAICGAMSDNGNFMLLDENNEPIWQTFKEPTDTILPGQILEMPSNLTSRRSQDNYSDDRFQLKLQLDGNLVLYYVAYKTEVNSMAYWATMSVKENASSKLVFDEKGYIYVQAGTKRIYNLTTTDVGSPKDFYHMARIDSYGVFTQFHYPKSDVCEKKWSAVQKIPENICNSFNTLLGGGICGYNGYCTEINGETKCLCLDDYSYLNRYSPNDGCRPNFELPSCQPDGWDADSRLVDFREYRNLDWPLSDYEYQSGSVVDLETCKQLCLDDCFCIVAIHNGNDCWKKRYPLSNGRKNTSVNRTALVKVPKMNSELYTKKTCDTKNQSTLVLVISILLGSSVFVNMLLILVISLAIFLYNKKLLNFSSASSASAANVRSYTYKELEEATSGFKQILGRGASGIVYKGVLASDPKRFVAVKKLDKVEQEGEREFKTEVNVIGQTHHKNLVRLLGYCDEGEHRLLIYEYMSNGSLANFLFGITRPDWNQRVQIALGIARGLMYLHEECVVQIIHCDIKPQNILLDEFSTPRISDFGLVKLLLAEQSRVTRTNKRGTIGYFAPEWFRKGSITVKIDVYSYGVVLLELICCKSSVAFGMGDQEEALMDWIYECYCKKKLGELVENDEEARNDMKRLERLVMVAIWCIQEDPSLRPTMKKVTQMLEGVTHVSVPPRP
ncbi:G-type lectin S-receptor-like serine/threonine-protein kinase LECRK3 [Manihot esculenta]|uniref:Receptor-like serine/threonine-protein kinase n=1 Tax=Manihot esculenta TaxID=3983 RepID=A0A2C9VIR3_MANES|nr:G-type lectin S-receptor-like serine/threonine-protein kinase LECRK3 [Manihot esculenta]OAY44731.1 hypothetical protein MANES_07G000900v8 [Manihot esculenta]